MLRRRLVNYSAAHTTALWAIGLAFAQTGLMLESQMIPLLVGLAIATLHLEILRSAEARAIRSEAGAVSFWALLRERLSNSASMGSIVGTVEAVQFQAEANRLTAKFKRDGMPFSLAIIEVRNGLAPDAALNRDAVAAVSDILRKLAGTNTSVLQTGDSEFALLLTKVDEAEAELFEWRVVRGIDSLRSTHPDFVAPIISVGLAECSESKRTIKALTRTARANRKRPAWPSNQLQAA